MKAKLKLFALMATIFFMSSFTDKNATDIIGTYGVSATDNSQIKLIIHPDHTFSYQDFSNADKKISVEGNWSIRGKKVRLHSTNSGTNFHRVWTIVNEGQVAKSRKGLSFYRLCKID